MAENNQPNQVFQGPVGSVGNQGSIGSSVGQVVGDQIGTQHNYAPEQRQSLADAAKEIQELLSQLSESYSVVEVPAKAVEKLDENPKLKDRVVGALKAGSKKALEELVKHPAAAIVLAAIEGAEQGK